MPRYVALLRGVSPMNAKMPELKRSFEAAGFTGVRTVLASGNVVFDARKASDESLERKAEAAMTDTLGRSFRTIVRSVEHLRALLEADPFAKFELPPDARRVVTFLRDPHPGKLSFPLDLGGARILGTKGREAFTIYVRAPGGPVFMTLIEKTFGKDVTTRTWETVGKCAAA